MKTEKQYSYLLNILLFCTGIILFAWFIHRTDSSRLWAFAGMALPCIALYRHTLLHNRAADILHLQNAPGFKFSLFTALMLGAGVAIYYRLNIGSPALPASITLFAPVALAIGMAEEFVFRGVGYSLFYKWPARIIIALTALLHAGYKTLLFLQPEILHPVDTWFLFYTTFLAGLVIGLLRHWGRSAIPPVAAHGLWDVIVYGDSPAAPWWVW